MSPIFADSEENLSPSGNKVVISINNGSPFKTKVKSPGNNPHNFKFPPFSVKRFSKLKEFFHKDSSSGTITPEAKIGPVTVLQSDDNDYFEESSENEITLLSNTNQRG